MSVTCPKCERQNPDEAYICQFCDAPLVTYSPPTIPQEEPVRPDPETPEWLNSLRQKKEEDAKELGEDFFNRFGPVEEKTPEAPKEEADLDGWLNRLREDEVELPDNVNPASVQEPGADEEPEANTPEWLASIRNKMVVENPPEVLDPSATGDEDWLARLRKQTDEEALVLDEVQGETPTWLSKVEETSLEELPGTLEPEPELEQASFLSNLENFEVPQFDSDTSPFYAESEMEEPEHPIPEQLRNMMPEIEEGSLPEELLPPEEELLKMSEEPREKIASKDIPSWLTTILGENEAEATSMSAVGAAQEDNGDPAKSMPGALPGWVQAMRPVEINANEKAAAQALDKHAETSGPLAGIRGTLSGDALLPDYAKAASYNVGVEQRRKPSDNISIFRDVLSIEKEEAKVPGYRRTRAAGTIRWVLMALLFASIFIPIISVSTPTNLTNSLPIETSALFQAVTSLPPGAKVLVAMDYEPAFAGEMEAAANGVFNHLMVKQAELVIISTSPTGPALAQKLLDDIAAMPQVYHADYVSGEKFHILGFLPGGQAGAQSLNTSLTNAIPVTLDLTKSASIPALGGPMPIQSFDALLILSDQPDTIRFWLEQVNTSSGKPGIWAIVSAQAAPMLKPYVRSGQLKGLVSGEYGGSLYERIFQQPGLARMQWNAFHTGLLSALVLILAGGVLNYVGQVIIKARRNKKS